MMLTTPVEGENTVRSIELKVTPNVPPEPVIVTFGGLEASLNTLMSPKTATFNTSPFGAPACSGRLPLTWILKFDDTATLNVSAVCGNGPGAGAASSPPSTIKARC